MIPATPLLRHLGPAAWQQALRECVSDPQELADRLGLGGAWGDAARRVAARFPLRVPRSYLARMRHGDATDPLLRQVLPLDAELLETPGYVADPVGDLEALAGPGLLPSTTAGHCWWPRAPVPSIAVTASGASFLTVNSTQADRPPRRPRGNSTRAAHPRAHAIAGRAAGTDRFRIPGGVEFAATRAANRGDSCEPRAGTA